MIFALVEAVKNIKNVVAVKYILFSAFLLLFSFWETFAFPLTFLALVPLLLQENLFSSKWKAGLNFFVLGLCFYLPLMFWLTKTTWIGYIILCFYLSIYFGIWGVLWFCFKNKFLLAVAWVLLEIIRAFLFSGIPWMPLGALQWKNVYFIQIASIISCFGISGVIIFINLVIAEIVQDCMSLRAKNSDEKRQNLIQGKSLNLRLPRRPPQVARLLAMTLLSYRTIFLLLFFIAVYGFGYYRISHDVKNKTEKLTVGIIHSEVPLDIKWNPFLRQANVKKYIKLSERAQKEKKCDLIVWPETCVPVYLKYEGSIFLMVHKLIVESGAYFLIGAPEYKDDENNKRDYYNSEFFFAPDGSYLGQYDKIHLVPCGEYTPFKKQFPWMIRLIPGNAEFSKGKEYTVFSCKGFRFASLICYEDIFPQLVKKFAEQNIDFIAVVSNDDWFYASQVRQHIAMSVFRAIEFNIPVLRSSNGGISCVIDKFGRVVVSQKKEGHIIYVFRK